MIELSSTAQEKGGAIPVKMQGKIEGILFDIDGTLFDSDPVHFDVFEELLGKEGIVCDENFFRTKIAGRQNQLIMQDLFPEWSPEKSAAWSDAKEARFRELAPGKLKAMPGLIELMDWIDAQGLKKAAVTNAPRDNAELMLNSIGRLEWFDCVIIGDECDRAKPDPMPYQLAMQKLGLEPSSTMVVEDSPSGATAGVAAGALTVGILTSQPAEILQSVGCKLLITDYHDDQFWAILKSESAN